MKFLLYFIVSTIFAGLIEAQDPKVDISETNPETKSGNLIIAIRDKDVTMDCHVENLPQATKVKWHRIYTNALNRTHIQDISTDEAANDNTKHGIEKPTQFTWRLRLKSIQVADEGKYQCYVSVILQSKVLDTRIIQVMIPPTLDSALTSTDMTVRSGDHVDLICNATGRPTPMIEWKRQGNALLPIGMELYRGSKLSIENVKFKDRGVYICRVFNAIDEIKRNIRLDVRFKPELNIPRPNVDQAVGYQIELQCLVEANPFPAMDAFKWVRDGYTITSSAGNYLVNRVKGAFNRLTLELIISKVTESDFGKFTCQVTNSEGTVRRDIILHKVDSPQKSIKLGRVIGGASSVTCSITSILFSVFMLCLL